ATHQFVMSIRGNQQYTHNTPLHD
ncbi:uncharacterized protein METZ01_LOCUS491576, partial [marine metagenome]